MLQATSRRLSLLFIANLALGDTLLPLVTSLSTPVLVTIHGGRDQGPADHGVRSLTCRTVQGLMTTIMGAALMSLVMLTMDRYLSIHQARLKLSNRPAGQSESCVFCARSDCSMLEVHEKKGSSLIG